MGASNSMAERAKKIRAIWHFIVIMTLMTGICAVVSEQKKSVVVAERMEIRGVMPDACLHNIREEETAEIYVLEEAGEAYAPYRVRKKTVILKERTPQGHLVAGANISGIQQVVSWSSEELADGDSVRVESREKLEKRGCIIFVNRESGERMEQSFFGIPQEEEGLLREKLSLGETWRCYLFADDEGESTPVIIRKLLWFCIAFYFAWIFLQWDVKKRVKELAEKRKRFYLMELIEMDMIKLLSHMILWVCLFWGLWMLAFACCNLDYGFLAAWLPEERTIDISHYRMIFDTWKADMQLYLNNYDDGYAAILRKNLKEWQALGYHMMAAAMLLSGRLVYCCVRSLWQNRKCAGS